MEIRTAEFTHNSDKDTVEGYAIVYNSPSEVLFSPQKGAFKETIASGAAREAIKSKDIRALYAHDEKAILGRTKSKTLQLSEDEHGIKYTLKLPKTSLGNDMRELIGRGDIQGASFKFTVKDNAEAWAYDRSQKMWNRTINSLDLYEITLTSSPAYSDTTAALRSLEAIEEAIKANHQLLKMKLRLKELNF